MQVIYLVIWSKSFMKARHLNCSTIFNLIETLSDDRKGWVVASGAFFFGNGILCRKLHVKILISGTSMQNWLISKTKFFHEEYLSNVWIANVFAHQQHSLNSYWHGKKDQNSRILRLNAFNNSNNFFRILFSRSNLFIKRIPRNNI